MSTTTFTIIMVVLAVLLIAGNAYGYYLRNKNGDFDPKYYDSKGELIFQKIWTCLFGTCYALAYWVQQLIEYIRRKKAEKK